MFESNENLLIFAEGWTEYDKELSDLSESAAEEEDFLRGDPTVEEMSQSSKSR